MRQAQIKGGYLKLLPIVAFDPKSPSALRIQECVVDLLTRMKKIPATATDRAQNERRLKALEEEIDDEVFKLYCIDEIGLRAVKCYLDSSGY